MARKFVELEIKMSPESLMRSDALYKKLITEIPLHEPIQAKVLSQINLAESLDVNQVKIKPALKHI